MSHDFVVQMAYFNTPHVGYYYYYALVSGRDWARKFVTSWLVSAISPRPNVVCLVKISYNIVH